MALETIQLRTATGAYAYITGDLVGAYFMPITKIDLGTDGNTAPASAYIPVRLDSALPAGAAAIGSVTVTSLPALPASSNAIGKLTTNPGVNIGDVGVTSLPSLSSGSAAIGKLAANSGVDIGDVDDPVSQAKLDTIIGLLGTSSAAQVWKSFNATTQQTGAAIWTPTSAKKVVITHFTIGVYGSTNGRVILWLGASGDTTYTEGTDQAVFKGSFLATALPGAVVALPVPILAVTADHILRITTDAAMSIDVVVYGYEI